MSEVDPVRVLGDLSVRGGCTGQVASCRMTTWNVLLVDLRSLRYTWLQARLDPGTPTVPAGPCLSPLSAAQS